MSAEISGIKKAKVSPLSTPPVASTLLASPTTSSAPDSTSSSSSSSLNSLGRGVKFSREDCITRAPVAIMTHQFGWLTPQELRCMQCVSSHCREVYRLPQITQTIAVALGLSYSRPASEVELKRLKASEREIKLSRAELNENMSFITVEVTRILAPRTLLPVAPRNLLNRYSHLCAATEAVFRTIPEVFRQNYWVPSTLFGRLFHLGSTIADIKVLHERGLDISRDYKGMLGYSFTHGTVESFAFFLTYLKDVTNPQELWPSLRLAQVKHKSTILRKIEVLQAHHALMIPFLQHALELLWEIPDDSEGEKHYTSLDKTVQDKLISLGAKVTQEAMLTLMTLTGVPEIVLKEMCGNYKFTPEFLIRYAEDYPEIQRSVFYNNLHFLVKTMACPVHQEVLYKICNLINEEVDELIDFLVLECKLVFDSTCLLYCLRNGIGIKKTWIKLESIVPTEPLFDAFVEGIRFYIKASLHSHLAEEEQKEKVSRESSEFYLGQELNSWFQSYFTFKPSHVLRLLYMGFNAEVYNVVSFCRLLKQLGFPLTHDTREIFTIVFPSFTGEEGVLMPATIVGEEEAILRYTGFVIAALKLNYSDDNKINLLKTFKLFLNHFRLALPKKAIELLMEETVVRKSDTNWLREMMPHRKWET